MPVERMPDTWELMGWKVADDMQNTAVMHIRDLTMFERGAFEEPLSPYSLPTERNVPDSVPAIGAYGNVGPVSGSGASFGGEKASAGYYGAPSAAGYPPYDPQGLGGYPAQPGNAPVGYPYGSGAPYGEMPYGMESTGYPDASGSAEEAHAGAPPRRPAPLQHRAAPSGPSGKRAHPPTHRVPPPKQRLTLAAMGPWRVGLLIVSLLALLFCVIEVGKIVHTMVLNEQQMKLYHESDPNGGTAVSGVDLLPAGVTYAPTATTAPVYTPTPTPIIDQNDPLIGVMDGGATASQYQSVLPTPTPATRTRLTQYPDNALLSMDDAFTQLRAENTDVVGQLVIDGVLNETVVQRNNTFYLNHNARGVQGTYGALFVDESCMLRKPPENLLIRGQITPPGKLFSALSQYGTQGAEFVRQHGIVTCDTLYEKARYAVFAVIHADSRTNSADYFNYASYPTFQSDAQMLRYVDAARQHSVYSIDVGVNASDRLLTLATLAEGSDTTCWVVICRMLRNGETDGNIQRQ